MQPRQNGRFVKVQSSTETPENSDPVPSGAAATANPEGEANSLLNGSSTRDPEASAPAVAGSEVPAAQENTQISATDPAAPYGRFANGKPRKSPRKSPPNARMASGPLGAAEAQPQASNPQGLSDDQLKMVAGTLNAGFFIVLQAIMGDEAAATKEEQKALNETLCNYMRTQNISMSPEMALACVYSAVIVSRMERPTFREKMKAKIVTLWDRFRNRKRAKKTDAPVVEGTAIDVTRSGS